VELFEKAMDVSFNLNDSIMFEEDHKTVASSATTDSRARSAHVPRGTGRMASINFKPPDALAESKRAFDEAMDVRSKTMHTGGYTKYSATQHNPLRGAGRPMSVQSMRLAKIGLDGLHRHDLKPDMQMKHCHSINQYYLTDLIAKAGTAKPCIKGTTVPRPIFTINGLQNHSSLPQGDPRVLRMVSCYRETYSDPGRRAEVCPQYDHVQEGEPVHDDNDLGPSATAPAKSGAMGEADAEVAARRRAYYRDAIEGTDVKRLDQVEAELKDKLRQSAMGPPLGGFNLRACYRFFDQDARGAIDLPAFKNALARLGLEWPFEPHLVVGLFARYDTQMRGFVDFYEMINEIIGQDWVDAARKGEMSGQIKGTVKAMRLTNNPDLGAVLGKMDVAEVDVHGLSDSAFLHRQRIRRVFRTIDRDNSGFIENNELDHLLVMLGVRVAPYELEAIYGFLDADASGKISFEEFYAWYTTKPAEPEELLERHRRPQTAPEGKARTRFR